MDAAAQGEPEKSAAPGWPTLLQQTPPASSKGLALGKVPSQITLQSVSEPSTPVGELRLRVRPGRADLAEGDGGLSHAFARSVGARGAAPQAPAGSSASPVPPEQRDAVGQHPACGAAGRAARQAGLAAQPPPRASRLGTAPPGGARPPDRRLSTLNAAGEPASRGAGLAAPGRPALSARSLSSLDQPRNSFGGADQFAGLQVVPCAHQQERSGAASPTSPPSLWGSAPPAMWAESRGAGGRPAAAQDSAPPSPLPPRCGSGSGSAGGSAPGGAAAWPQRPRKSSSGFSSVPVAISRSLRSSISSGMAALAQGSIGSGRQGPHHAGGLAAQASLLARRSLDALDDKRLQAAPYCRGLVRSRAFQVASLVALVAALFLPDLWIVLDRPDNSDLDVILTCVLMLFLVELAVQSVGLSRTYWGSFFFWMDVLGAASMLLDLSYVPLFFAGSAGEPHSNAMVLKTARMSKLGARAGRFAKLLKLLRFLPGMRLQGADQGTARVISAQLLTSLSTRVSCLIIFFVMAMPLFSFWTYPQQDWSMQSWLEVLEAAARERGDTFPEQTAEFWQFYDELAFYPYSLDARPGAQVPDLPDGSLPWAGASRSAPRRAANSVRHQGEFLVCDFNFQAVNQMDSAMNLGVLCLVIVLMVVFSMMLSNIVSDQVLRPLENLLLQVRRMASTIFQSVTDMADVLGEDSARSASEQDGEDDEESEEAQWLDERLLLERVVRKLITLTSIAVQRAGADLEGLGERDREMVTGFQGHAPAEGARSRQAARPLEGNEEDEADSAEGEGDEDRGGGDESEEDSLEEGGARFRSDGSEGAGRRAPLSLQRAMLENAGLTLDLIDSNNLNTLELDRSRNQAAAAFFLGQGGHCVPVERATLEQFIEAAEGRYLKTCPYHNWFHAVDVSHCVYRQLRAWAAEAYLSSPERFALLVSAVAHDMGHPGLNNAFLAETSHELALRYNDRSPLENLHCAQLFELTGQPRCNVFAGLSRADFLEARKTCIEAILHTDNSHHFAMIKDVQMLYEVNSHTFDAQRGAADLEQFRPGRDAVEHLRQPESKKLLVRVSLHVADISNPTRPFRICRIWAWKIMEEFFLQGDQEKALGLPVQALNDRDKVNRPLSQVGFVEFLVSPLLFAVAKVLPPTLVLAERAVQSAHSWHALWLAEGPPQDERAALAERMARLQARLEDLSTE